MRFFVVVYCIYYFICLGTGAKYEEKYSENEMKALSKFRPIGTKLVSKEYQKKDIYLIHWLRAKDLDIEAATKMLQKAMSWRKQNKVDDILKDKEIITAIQKTFPGYSFVTKDKVGRPALLTLFSRWDMRKGHLRGFDSYRMNIYNLEKLTSLAYQSNHSEYLSITDLNQFSLRQHACTGCLSVQIFYMDIYENYYPNMIKAHYLINAPKAYEVIMRVISPLWSTHTSKTTKIFGIDKQEWQPALLELFDPTQLTLNFGGVKLDVWN